MDPFRTTYRELSAGEKDLVTAIKEVASDLYIMFDAAAQPPDLGASVSNLREMALAKTKLEEAVMWAVKGITK